MSRYYWNIFRSNLGRIYVSVLAELPLFTTQYFPRFQMDNIRKVT
jgi:hypothetical protein